MFYWERGNSESEATNSIAIGGASVARRTFGEPAARAMSEDQLIAELADLEAHIRLLDAGQVDQEWAPAKQELVDAEYAILGELRRRQSRTRSREWTTLLRPQRARVL